MVMKVRAHVFVSGRVQGVFFRFHTKEWAYELNVKGWVRNLPNGKVEAVLEGEEEDVKELIDRMREGPPLARVDSVEVIWEEYKGEYKDFIIRY